MTEKIKQDVSGTAFIVNYSRSKMVDVSLDVYARLWVTPDAISLWNDLAENVYPNDDLNLSLRNRFFLEQLKKFVAEHEDPVFVNIASGFTSYPFLIEGNCEHVEFDLPNIVELKKKKVAQWMKDGTLPQRTVEFYSADLSNDDQRNQMGEKLKRILHGRPSFVLMEGLTYYLTQDILSDIFKIVGSVQKEGSVVAFDYWEPDASAHPIMMKLKEYLNKRFGSSGQDWNLFDEKYIKAIKGYAEIESSDVAKQELKYSESRIFQKRDDRIPVNYSVLERI